VAHRLAGQVPGGQIFLPLRAHTPGQRPAGPADGLASLLRAAGASAQSIRAGLDARAGCWRDYLVGRKVLLVLDDATGHEQVRPLLPGTAGSLVLITSRRRLTALEDAAVISLDTLPPDEAAQLLAGLAARSYIGPGDKAVAEITRRGGPGPAGADARREPVGRRRVQPVLPGPDRRAAAAVPPARPAPRPRHRRPRRPPAGRHQPG